MAQTVNITKAMKFYLGTDKKIRLTLTGSDDITSWAIKFVLSAQLPSPGATVEQLIVKTVTAGINIVSGVNRIIDIVFEDTETDGSADSFSASKTYYYSVKRTDAGEEDILVEGTWQFCVASQRQE